MIHYISPYRTDKNIGRALNEACAIVPDDDWICCTDYDVMFPLPQSKALIEEIVNGSSKTEGDFLLGCMTNRLSEYYCKHQLVGGKINEDGNLLNHIEIAKERAYSNYWKDRIRDADIVAGFFMLFKKSTWNKIKFKENDLQFDIKFSQDVKKIGGYVGIMQGLYVIHLYRLGHKNPSQYIEHLKA